MFPKLIELLLIGLFGRINLDSKIQIKYNDTKNQLADILTKGKFTTWWMESFVDLVEYQPCQLYCLHRSDGKTSSTRIRRRTCHSQIATHEFDREDAFGRVFFNFIKPGEDLVWISRSWKNLFQVTIDQGNLWKRQDQIIYKRIMADLGLLKSGTSGAAEHDRSGKPEENSEDMMQKSCPSSWGASSRQKCAFCKVRRADSR